jgi:hypothetical protein
MRLFTVGYFFLSLSTIYYFIKELTFYKYAKENLTDRYMSALLNRAIICCPKKVIRLKTDFVLHCKLYMFIQTVTLLTSPALIRRNRCLRTLTSCI